MCIRDRYQHAELNRSASSWISTGSGNKQQFHVWYYVCRQHYFIHIALHAMLYIQCTWKVTDKHWPGACVVAGVKKMKLGWTQLRQSDNSIAKRALQCRTTTRRQRKTASKKCETDPEKKMLTAGFGYIWRWLRWMEIGEYRCEAPLGATRHKWSKPRTS